VPVGEDQRQHLEFARECAANFNAAHGSVLVPPTTLLCEYLRADRAQADAPAPAKRIMSLQRPRQKMSKSAEDARSRILLTDSRAAIRAKIGAALTDSHDAVSYDPAARPGVSNLLRLLAHLAPAPTDPAALARRHADLRLGAFKGLVADALADALDGPARRFARLMRADDGRYLDDVERRGAARARASALATMELVRQAVGL
jgi:tryptophanyl-tRNA synthetase